MEEGWAHTFAAAAVQLEFLPGWVHRAAARQVTLWQLYFCNGKKKYKLNFIKKKKSQNQKSIVFRYGKTCKQGLGFSFISCLWRWGSAFNGFLDFSQVALLCVVPLSLVSETLKIQKYDGLLLLSAVKFGRSNKLVYNKKTTDKILLVSEILFLRKKNKRQQF